MMCVLKSYRFFDELLSFPLTNRSVTSFISASEIPFLAAAARVPDEKVTSEYSTFSFIKPDATPFFLIFVVRILLLSK